MAHEIELKFDLGPGDVERLRACPSLAAEPFKVAAYETRYFDTRDGALRRAGYSLRVRRSNGRFIQTVKRKRSPAAGLFVRKEWDCAVKGFAVDRAALLATPLKRLLGEARLVATARTRFTRTAWLIARGGSRIELVLDEGKVTAGKAETPLCELELELIEGKAAALFALAAEIGAAVPLRLGVLTKNERGQALAEGALGRPASAVPIQLSASLSEAQAFRVIAHACLRHYRLNEIVLLREPDPDALHQARIALRRLRSALSLFGPTLRGKDYQRLRDELGWLAGRLGDARTLDVALAGEAAAAADGLLRVRLLKARGKAYDRVASALASDRVRRLMLDLALWMETGAWRFRERSGREIGPLAVRQLERQWRKVRRHAAGIGEAADDERHRLRLDIKKLRYSAEFLAGLCGKRPRQVRRDRFIAALKDLQDRLGDLNDSEASAAMTARLAPSLKGSADRIRREALAREAIAAARDALHRATLAAGYWL
jgi:triphosphatase